MHRSGENVVVEGGLSAIVLAGGRSRRMGRDKALLRLGGQTQLERTIRVVREITAQVIVVGREDIPDVPAVQDIRRGIGPLGGLLTGLSATGCRYAVAVGVDHPYLKAEVLRHLAGLCPGFDAVVPVSAGRLHTTHAVYAAGTVAIIDEQIARGEYSIRSLLARLNVRWVREEEVAQIEGAAASLRNVNTPEEWSAVAGSEGWK